MMIGLTLKTLKLAFIGLCIQTLHYTRQCLRSFNLRFKLVLYLVSNAYNMLKGDQYYEYRLQT